MTPPECPRCGSGYHEDLGPDGVKCHNCGRCYYPAEVSLEANTDKEDEE